MYVLRCVGGLLYLAGGVIMTINIWRTILGHHREEAPLYSAHYDPAVDHPLVPAE